MQNVRRQCTVNRQGWWPRTTWLVGIALVWNLHLPADVAAQQIFSQPESVIDVPRGQSVLYVMPPGSQLVRVSVTDPDIADVVVSQEGPGAGRELVINGNAVGSTTLILWDALGQARIYTIQVAADVDALQRQLRLLYPDAQVSAVASGSTIILSGEIRDPTVVRRIMQIASATGATVVNNISAPSAQQILLHVRFAEVNRTVVENLSFNLLALNPDRLDGAVGADADMLVETLSEGLVRLLLIGADAQLEALIRALKSTGDFRSLAEPNLVTLEGEEATFLAGGEFPFPVVQPQGQGITIQWREFGVRLAFTPNVTNLGSIRLRVTPEVSSLDFANALTLSGFQVPSLLTRRAESEVELWPGQHLAIAGLLDQSTLEGVDRIPFLGNLPILGALFRSRAARQNQTELLVVVTPYIVEPVDFPIPVPTGEPGTWRWDRRLRPPPDTAPMHPR